MTATTAPAVPLADLVREWRRCTDRIQRLIDHVNRALIKGENERAEWSTRSSRAAARHQERRAEVEQQLHQRGEHRLIAALNTERSQISARSWQRMNGNRQAYPALLAARREIRALLTAGAR